MHRFLTVIIILLHFPLLGAQSNWKQVRDKEGIKVYTRLNEGYDFKEFKGLTSVDAEVSEFVAVLQDIEALPSWGYKIKETRLLDKTQDTVRVYYLITETPFPYDDRDGVYKNVFHWNREKESLTVDIKMLDLQVEREEGLVPMNGFGSWQVRKKNGQLEISFQMQMDLGGGIPAWLANLFAGDTPYHTLLNLKEKLKDPNYMGKEFSFLK